VAGVQEPAAGEFAGRMEVVSGVEKTDEGAVDVEDSDPVELLEEEREECGDPSELAGEAGVRKRDKVLDGCLVDGCTGVLVR